MYVCLSVCLSVLFGTRPADVELNAMHLTTGHVVSIHSLARPLARPLDHPPIRPSTQSTLSPDQPSTLSPARRHANPPPNHQISLKAFHTIHLTQAMWYPFPAHRTGRLLRNGRPTSPSNPRLLTNIYPLPRHRRGILSSVANLQAVWPTNYSVLCAEPTKL